MALEIYRETRQLFVDELGLEPSPALRELEQAILRRDPALASQEVRGAQQRAILVVASDPRRLDDLLAIAEPIARRPERELILARLLRDDAELAAANAKLSERRDDLARRGIASRTATYTEESGTDTVRLATEYHVDVVLLDAAPGLLETGHPDEDLAAVLERAPCDVAVLGGGEMPANPAVGRRDASRLMSRASMLVQQVVGIVTEPVPIRPGEEGLLEAARDVRLLVVGLSDRWRTEVPRPGTRLAVAKRVGVPTLFVRRGLRPSGVAPSETLTRFTWTLGSEGILAR